MIIESVDVVWECERNDWWAIDMEKIWEKEEWDEIIEKWKFEKKNVEKSISLIWNGLIVCRNETVVIGWMIVKVIVIVCWNEMVVLDLWYEMFVINCWGVIVFDLLFWWDGCWLIKLWWIDCWIGWLIDYCDELVVNWLFVYVWLSNELDCLSVLVRIW